MRYIPSKGKDRDAVDVAKAIDSRAELRTYQFVQGSNLARHKLPFKPRGRIIVGQTYNCTFADVYFNENEWSYVTSLHEALLVSGILGSVTILWIP